MSKYAGLQNYLEQISSPMVSMTFSEIEKVIGAPLPKSSRRHRAWWSNNPNNNVMTRAWLAAGYRTADVDIDSGRLTFERPPGQPVSSVSTEGDADLVCRHPLFGALKGMVQIAPGIDLTESLFPEDWEPKLYNE